MRRTILHPRTLQPIRPVGYRRDGRAIWPVLGASEPPNQPPADPPAPPPADPPADPGFPANTPWREMAPEQQVAYWQHQSRRHETRAQAFNGLTPEQLAEMREKATRHDALERELMSDKDKAIAEAREQAQAEAAATLRPRLVAAEFKAAAAGRIEPDKLATILEPLDLGRFLTDSGDVDTAKVAAYVDGIAPATGASYRSGPSAGGAGRTGSYTTGSSSVASGREMYAERHKTSTSRG